MAVQTWEHHNVADNVHDIIRLTDLEFRIKNGALFSRLHYVYQDSTAFLTWPSLRIQRFEHSLGTMHLAGEMFYAALANSDDETIEAFSETVSSKVKELINQNYIDKWHIDDGSSPSMKLKSQLMTFVAGCADGSLDLSALKHYSFLVPSNIPKTARATCMYVAQGVRVAGMLHDIGHPPFSHVCEYVLQGLYKSGKSDQLSGNESARDLVAHIDSFVGEGKSVEDQPLHELVGNSLSTLAVTQAVCGGTKTEVDLFEIAAGIVALAALNDKESFTEIHSLVCGVIDADRLDFVQRDSISSGVGVSAMQYARLSEGLRLMQSDDSGKFVFALPSKAITSVEDFLRKRFNNYKTIVYHYRVVESEALLKAILATMAGAYFAGHPKRDVDVPVGGESPDLYILPLDISGLWQPIAVGLENETDAVLSFSQWNDAWLFTTLRKEYTRLKIASPTNDVEKVLLAQLEELLLASRYYEPVVKRPADCSTFRRMLAERIEEHRDGMDEYLDECKNRVPPAKGNMPDDQDSGLEASSVIDAIKRVVDAPSSTNVLREVDRSFDAFRMALGQNGEYAGVEDFTGVFKKAVESSLREVGCRAKSVLVERNGIKTGVGGEASEVRFYGGKGKATEQLGELSVIGELLAREEGNMPAFFTFMLPERAEDASLCHSNSFFALLADKMFKFIYDCVVNAADFIQ